MKTYRGSPLLLPVLLLLSAAVAEPEIPPAKAEPIDNTGRNHCYDERNNPQVTTGAFGFPLPPFGGKFGKFGRVHFLLLFFFLKSGIHNDYPVHCVVRTTILK